MINLKGIRNIILDLGGVVVDLDVGLTVREFADLGLTGLDKPDIVMARYPFFRDYETGRINTGEFLACIQEILEGETETEKIIRAWNAMILDTRADTLRLLRSLRGKFRLFLLSNTNDLHIRFFNERLLARHGIRNFEEVFDKVYYSHIIGMRKPDREIFDFVLKDSRISSHETLYIDDTEAHIQAAGRLGIRVYHLQPPQKLTGVLLN